MNFKISGSLFWLLNPCKTRMVLSVLPGIHQEDTVFSSEIISISSNPILNDAGSSNDSSLETLNVATEENIERNV